MKTLAAFLSIYISPDGEERLSQYHYTGKDNSFLQRYLYIPIADFFLDHVIPSWLKPLLTFCRTDYLYIIAFIFVLYPHIIIAAMFSGDLNGHVHRWLSFITAFSLFLYLVLKSTGRRKAERRGYITPLNAFLDHQTNTVNIFLTGLSFFAIIQLGNTDYSVIAFIVAFVPFYTATWERYYTGEYNRPVINGQTEGLTVIVLIEVITGIGGYGIWPQPSESGLRSNEILVLITAALAVLAVFFNFRKVWIKARARFGRALFDLLWIGYTVAMLFVLSYMSVTNTVSRRARDLITYVGLFLGKYCGLLQVAHMSGDKFKSFWYSKYIANSFLIADCVQGYYTATNMIDEDFTIQTLMIYQFIRYIIFLVSILFQMNEIQKRYPSHLPLKEKLKLDLKSITQYGFTERPDSHAHADHAKTPTSQASTDTPIKLNMISLQKKMISLPLVLPEKPPLAVDDCRTP